MGLRSFFRKRLHVSISLHDPSLASVHAAGESSPSVGGWFSANFGVGNLFAVLGLAGTLIGGYASLKTENATEAARLDAAETRINSLNERFRTQVVGRDEYQNNSKDLNLRIDTLQSGQTQIMGHLLQEAK